ncbi:hypothetical protein EV424DRAFT_1348350 [Suillus variegatus]|nr:hypothetical protein EV424DRAFT_1348350 [Suillus variegatus]
MHLCACLFSRARLILHREALALRPVIAPKSFAACSSVLLPPLAPYTASYPPSRSSVSSLLPLFWRSPGSSAYIRATSAFADVRRACALSTGGCWDRVGVGHGYAHRTHTRTRVYGYIPVAGTGTVGLETPRGFTRADP